MKFVLFFAAIYFSGPGAHEPRGFKTLEDCQSVLAKTPLLVAQWNATNDDKISAFAAGCIEVKPAKQGIDG
jgi:hypothetical protein